MSRGHLAYPLVRPVDGDAGGAADLQTDIMRFMAILALCLLAIFALVQSLPPVPVATETEGAVSEPEKAPDSPAVVTEASLEPAPTSTPMPAKVELTRPAPAQAREAAEPVVLTRPKPRPVVQPEQPVVPVSEPPPPADDKPGFTLRFESDLALSRLVATGQVGLFALNDGSAQRMSVVESRISFWAAPVPRKFHEMDRSTVPAAARDALARTGRTTDGTTWAVTLPARLSGELDRIMSQFQGGTLIIRKDGSLQREPG
ncbi:MAG: hypothetical protein QNJ05_11640 [Woeseiaceae bacterium]|nr:hypothetical protein [Woeseiaceae bacterium]